MAVNSRPLRGRFWPYRSDQGFFIPVLAKICEKNIETQNLSVSHSQVISTCNEVRIIYDECQRATRKRGIGRLLYQ